MNPAMIFYRYKKVFGLFVLSFAMLAAIACGTSGDSFINDAAEGDAPASAGNSASILANRILSPTGAYGLDDLLAAGFKKSKQYDVTDLPAAVEVYYGFFGLDPYNRQEFEIRFYASHEDVLNIGVEWANEGTGLEAILLQNYQRWDEGLRERRICAANGGHHIGKCDNAKYSDYVIVGNMILMCQGKDVSESRGNCDGFLEAMGL